MPSSKELREVLRNLAQDWRNRMVYAGSDEERSVYPVLADELEAALTATPEQAPLERDARFLVTPFQPLAQPSTAKQAPGQEALTGVRGLAVSPDQQVGSGEGDAAGNRVSANPPLAKAAPSGAQETSAPHNYHAGETCWCGEKNIGPIRAHAPAPAVEAGTPWDARVKKTPTGPELWIGKVQVRTWFGTMHNDEAQRLADRLLTAGCRGVAAAPQLSEEQVMAAVVIARSQGIAEATKYLNDGPAAPGAGQ